MSLKEEMGEIRQNYIENCMNELKKAVNDFKKGENKGFAKAQIVRVLKLVHEFLNASESRGTRGLRPHNALSRGKKWHLTVNDRVNPR